ncbi:MAG: hypothetical protein R3C69_09260 [Geminicoccaceae bacterium]
MSMSGAQRPKPQRQGANLPDTGLLLELFEQMVLLRRFELAARAACRGGETPGFLHLISRKRQRSAFAPIRRRRTG